VVVKVARWDAEVADSVMWPPRVAGGCGLVIA
jgi:hypothetical protein